MSEEKLISALKEIRGIADAALKGVGRAPKLQKDRPRIKGAAQSRPESLPDQILRLREDRFFTQPKTYNEVHAKIQSVYPCDGDRVKVACLRLQKRKELRKSSKIVGKKSQVAYVW